jgi:hypothetical protein
MSTKKVSSTRRPNNRRIEEEDTVVSNNDDLQTTASQFHHTSAMDLVEEEKLRTSVTFVATIDTTLSGSSAINDQKQAPSHASNKGSANNVSTNARPITAASLGQLQHVPPMWLVSSTNIVSAMNSVNKNNREHSQMLCLLSLIDSEKVNKSDSTTMDTTVEEK